jgi:hypothetical protein
VADWGVNFCRSVRLGAILMVVSSAVAFGCSAVVLVREADRVREWVMPGQRRAGANFGADCRRSLPA